MQPLGPRFLGSPALLCIAALLLPAACASDPPRDTSDNGADGDDDDDEDDDDGDDADDDDDGSSRDGGNSRGNNPEGGRGGNNDSTDGGRGGSGDSGASGGDAQSSGGNSGGACSFIASDTGWVAANTNAAMVQGAVFTYASMGSTIMPMSSESAPFKPASGGRLCVKGSAAQVVDMMYSVYYGAGLGFDLCANGASDSPPNQKYTISTCPRGKDLVGLRFKVTGSTVPTELRVQFKEAAREESAYVLAKSGANTVMFKDGRVAYSMTAPPVDVSKIEAVQFAIPTNDAAPTPFDFCVEDTVLITSSGTCKDGGNGSTGNTGGSDAGSSGMSDAGGGSTTDSDAGGNNNGGNDNGGGSGGMCTKGNPAFTSSEQYATRTFGKYILRNNVWGRDAPGAGSQTIWGNGPGCWGVDSQHQQVAGAAGRVKSYPNIMRGWGIKSPMSPNSGFPIRVSDIRKGKIRWKMQVTAGRMWALWDIYFHHSANLPPQNASGNDAEASVNLMIQQYIVEDQDRWMIKDSESWKRVTIGQYKYRHRPTTPSSSNEGDRGDVSNPSWSRNQIKLYVDELNGNNLGKQDMTIDLKEMIDWAIQEGSLKPTDYLVGIQAGYEIVAGGTYVTHDFWTSINDEAEGN